LKSVIGVGRSYKGLESVYKSLDDAVKSVEAYGNYSKEEIVFFEDLGIYKIFCHEELKDELVGFYNENLKKLVEYDEKRDANLVKTLNMYFQQNGNLKRMSEELFTHYNTILYRMKRIQEICDIDINNRKERYDIETALEIHKIINA
jgi:purine catabolism regulator